MTKFLTNDGAELVASGKGRLARQRASALGKRPEGKERRAAGELRRAEEVQPRFGTAGLRQLGRLGKWDDVTAAMRFWSEKSGTRWRRSGRARGAEHVRRGKSLGFWIWNSKDLGFSPADRSSPRKLSTDTERDARWRGGGSKRKEGFHNDEGHDADDDGLRLRHEALMP